MNINQTIKLFVWGGGLFSAGMYNAILAENNPPPSQIALLSGLYSCILYYYLFYFIVFYLTPVLIRFVKVCVCRDLYTTRARMRIASP